MKKKVNKYISSFDYIVYLLSHVTNIQIFWSQLSANDVMPCVLIYYYYYYSEIIYDIQNMKNIAFFGACGFLLKLFGYH